MSALQRFYRFGLFSVMATALLACGASPVPSVPFRVQCVDSAWVHDRLLSDRWLSRSGHSYCPSRWRKSDSRQLVAMKKAQAERQRRLEALKPTVTRSTAATLLGNLDIKPLDFGPEIMSRWVGADRPEFQSPKPTTKPTEDEQPPEKKQDRPPQPTSPPSDDRGGKPQGDVPAAGDTAK